MRARIWVEFLERSNHRLKARQGFIQTIARGGGGGGGGGVLGTGWS